MNIDFEKEAPRGNFEETNEMLRKQYHK